MVEKILIGAIDPLIGVLNIELRPKKRDLDKIRVALAYLRGKRDPSLSYNEMTSLIGQVTTEMQQELILHLSVTDLDAIPKALLPLYQAISEATDKRMSWQERFRTWAKANKPSSEIRLKIVEDYIDVISVLDSSVVSVANSLFAGAGCVPSPSLEEMTESDLVYLCGGGTAAAETESYRRFGK
jgi:hypothetical protein